MSLLLWLATSNASTVDVVPITPLPPGLYLTFADLYGPLLDRELGTTDRTIAFKAAVRQAVINEGQREFNRLTNCFVRKASFNLEDGDSEFDLETIAGGDYLRPAKEGPEVVKVDAAGSATYYSGDDLPRRDIPWLHRFAPGWRTTTPGNPQSYYLTDDGGTTVLGLYPAVRVLAGESMTAKVPYIALPANMVNDTDVPFTADGNPKTTLADWHKALVHFGAAQLEKYVRKNQQGYADQMQLFGGYVADYLSQQHPKGGQQVTFARTYYRRRGSNRIQDPRRTP